MKEKSPKPVAATYNKQATVSGRGLIPPAYGINFVDRQSNSNDATVQGVFESSSEEIFSANPNHPARQQKENKTGLPDKLKSGIENISGFSMNDVKVHFNSDKPTQLNAHAYTQGTEIHVAPGQEKHLPHEAWHVVQQKQGRVQPTMQMKDEVNINDDGGLEKEADVMGEKAFSAVRVVTKIVPQETQSNTIQRRPIKDEDKIYKDDKYTDVKLEQLNWKMYKIINEGAFKDQIVIYDVDMKEYYYPDEYEDADYERPFNISSVSNMVVQAPPPTKYESIGENGKGVGNVAQNTTLETTGLITCIGWLLFNDKAAYLTHIVVLQPENVVADGYIKSQVNELSSQFELQTGSKPTRILIKVDEGQPAYKKESVWMSAWMQELVPDGCQATWIKGEGDLTHVVQPNAGARQEWSGAPIKVKYPADL